jgi:hypothetical protein
MDENVEIRPQLIVGNENQSETRKIDEAEMAGILQRLGNSLEKLAKKIRDSDLYTPKHTR